MANMTGRISFNELLTVAMDSVWQHRFRSGLTVLGIVIGITTVVTVSSLLTGLRAGITTFFSEFGPDNVFISRYSGDPNQPPPPSELRRRNVGPESAEMIKRLVKSVEEVSVSMILPGFIGRSPITAKVPGFESDQVNMVGLTASGFVTQPKNFLSGRPFTEEEERRAARVCVMGPKLAEALFPSSGADAPASALRRGEAHQAGAERLEVREHERPRLLVYDSALRELAAEIHLSIWCWIRRTARVAIQAHDGDGPERTPGRADILGLRTARLLRNDPHAETRLIEVRSANVVGVLEQVLPRRIGGVLEGRAWLDQLQDQRVVIRVRRIAILIAL